MQGTGSLFSHRCLHPGTHQHGCCTTRREPIDLAQHAEEQPEDATIPDESHWYLCGRGQEYLESVYFCMHCDLEFHVFLQVAGLLWSWSNLGWLSVDLGWLSVDLGWLSVDLGWLSVDLGWLSFELSSADGFSWSRRAEALNIKACPASSQILTKFLTNSPLDYDKEPWTFYCGCDLGRNNKMTEKTTSSTSVVDKLTYIFLNKPSTPYIDWIRFSDSSDAKTGLIWVANKILEVNPGPISSIVYGPLDSPEGSIRLYYVDKDSLIREIKLQDAHLEGTDPRSWVAGDPKAGSSEFEGAFSKSQRKVDAASFLTATSTKNRDPVVVYKAAGEDYIYYTTRTTTMDKSKWTSAKLDIPEDSQ